MGPVIGSSILGVVPAVASAVEVKAEEPAVVGAAYEALIHFFIHFFYFHICLQKQKVDELTQLAHRVLFSRVTISRALWREINKRLNSMALFVLNILMSGDYTKCTLLPKLE